MAPPSSLLFGPGGAGSEEPSSSPDRTAGRRGQQHDFDDVHRSTSSMRMIVTQATGSRTRTARGGNDDMEEEDDNDDGAGRRLMGDGIATSSRTINKKPRLEMPPPIRLELSQQQQQQQQNKNVPELLHRPRRLVKNSSSTSATAVSRIVGNTTTTTSRRTNDEIHSTISLCPVTCLIMDTPEFQRLKGIKQLGSADFVYMNCNTTRFEHSVGVSDLARRMVTQLAEKQPQLCVSSKDILCVKLAGLLHDVGHGPYSHVYEQFQEYLTSHLMNEQEEIEKEGGNTTNPTLTNKGYEDTIHPLDVPYQGHESVSLRVIRHMFETTLGLPLNWDDLDAPLLVLPPTTSTTTTMKGASSAAVRGGGTNVVSHTFGVDDDDDDGDGHEGAYLLEVASPIPSQLAAAASNSTSTTPRADDDEAVLTTRDVLFVMECIWGKPIDQYETILGPGFHGRPSHKEWLYDIVCNRHSGLDVDKIDYYARDERRAFKGAGEIDVPMIEEAVVAWAECENPDSCHKCQYRSRTGDHHGASSRHLMVCYPQKLIPTCMDFFKKRFELHTKIYSHKTSVGTSYMICDILRAADPYFRLPVLRSTCQDSANGASKAGSAKREYTSLPISRAFVDPDVFLRCRDSVLDQIANTTDPNLAEARSLIARMWSRDIYKCAVSKVLDMQTERNLWELSEKDIVDGMLQVRGVHRDESTGKELVLDRRDILVHKCNIHHGSKDNNPLLQMRFVEKQQLHKLARPLELLPEATAIQESRYEARLPRRFAERSLRIYSRDSAKEALVRHVFEQWYAEFVGEMELTPCGMDVASGSAFGVNPKDPHGDSGNRVAFFCSQESYDDDDNNNNDYGDDDNEGAPRGGLDRSPAPRPSPGGSNGGGLGQVTPIRR